MATYPSVAAICQQIHPPTGVTHCASAAFSRCLPPNECCSQLPNLIVVRATQLEVHYVSPELKLELVDRYPLYGEVESMAVLKSRAKSGQRDALVLAFRDAKVSVIEWDDATDGIRTSSLHCFENDPALRGGHEVFPFGPRVAADPQGRCICCLIYMSQIAVLPAMDPDYLNDESQISRGALVGNSYVLNLGKLGIQEVRDYVFLHGYNEPVILILHEQNPTWPARFRERKDTCCLTAISLNFQEKIYPVIWSAKGLPSDAHKLIAVPARGALVLSLNLIAYYSQGQNLAVGVNPSAFAGEVPQRVELDPAVEVPSVTATKLAVNYANNVHPECAPAISKGASLAAVSGIELKAAQHSWLDTDSLILALRSGQLVSVHLKTDGSKVISIQLSKCGSAPIVSCATVVSEGILFLGSWLGDSLLAKFTRHQRMDDSEDMKQGQSQNLNDGNEDVIDLDALDEDQLFGVDLEKGNTSDVDYHLHVVDVLQCIGPIRDMVAGAPPEAEGLTQHTSLSPQVVACVGAGRGGALAVMRRGVVAEVLTEVPVPDVVGVWALHYRDEDEAASLMVADVLAHSYLVIASSTDTMVLESGEELEEVTKRSDFVTTESTIFAGSLFRHTRILQVCPKGVWLFRGTELCQEISSEDMAKDVYPEKQRPQSQPSMTPQAEVDAHGGQQTEEIIVEFPSAFEGEGDKSDVELSDEDCSKDTFSPMEAEEDKSIGDVEDVGDEVLLDGRSKARNEEGSMVVENTPEGTYHLQQSGAVEGVAEDPGKILLDAAGGRSKKSKVFEAEDMIDFQDELMDYECDLDVLGVVGVEQNVRIKSASVSDPLLLILLDNGEAVLLEGDPDSRLLYPMETASYALRQLPRENYLAQIASCALFSDSSLWLSEGATSALFPAPLFCVVCRKGGSMEVYDLPQMDCIFSVCGFSLGWSILGNNLKGEGFDSRIVEEELEEPIPSVVEVRMESFIPPYPRNSSDIQTGACVSGRPIIFAVLDDGSLLVYRAFRTKAQPLAFKRVELETMGDGGAGTLGQGGTIPAERDRMVRFDTIGEDSPCSGIFVAGVTPLLLVASQSGIMVHRLLVDGAVTSMTPFSNINCPQGFILAMTSRQLKICSLHKERLDCPWPCHKVALRCAPNKIAWYPDSRLYLVLCSRPIAFRERVEEEEGGDTHSAAAYAVSNQAAKLKGYEEGHEVRLMIPGSWTTPWLFPLDPNELGLSVRSVHLKDQSDGTVHPMVAVGTAFTIGEDYPSTGRCLLFRIHKEGVASDESGDAPPSQDSWSGVVACSHEVRGPVSALAVLDGCLLMAAGNRLELCAWNGSALTRMAFFDGPLYITSVNVVKSFVLFGDLHKGIHFVWYTYPVSGHETSPDAREILLLGKDFNHSDVHATEFLVNGTTLSFIFADGGKNVRIHSYHRDHPDSWNGRKLLPEGSFHIGHLVGRMVRMRLCCPDGVNRQAAVYGTMDGGLGYVAPMWDQSMFKRLMALQQVLAKSIVHCAGLNPVAFRMRHRKTPKSLGGGSQHGKPPPKERILDGDLLFNFWFLDRIKQLSLAHTIGTSRRQIIEDLQGIALATSFF